MSTGEYDFRKEKKNIILTCATYKTLNCAAKWKIPLYNKTFQFQYILFYRNLMPTFSHLVFTNKGEIHIFFPVSQK